MFETLKCFRCKKCGATYFEEAPAACKCETSLEEGKIVGSFRLIKRLEDRKWRAICLLCDLETRVNETHVRKQKSCGCKPRHIDILNQNPNGIRFRCTKCRTVYSESYPIWTWCCSDEEENGNGENLE